MKLIELRNKSGKKDFSRKAQKTDSKIVSIDRVTKVVKGGKKMSFRVVVVFGDKKGRVGVGVGNAGSVMDAIEKAKRNAKAHVIFFPLTRSNSVAYPVKGKFCASTVILKPSAPGSGVIAGGSSRLVLELAGVENILAKQLGSNNRLNSARATIDGLTKLIRN
jgi:small subunit ribosomal protein S5